jgi:Ni,Fe-hydrogenase I cytochrome b subunit
MEAEMAEHKHGEMDTKVQEKTFDGFIRLVTWGSIISIGTLIFMALVNG